MSDKDAKAGQGPKTKQSGQKVKSKPEAGKQQNTFDRAEQIQSQRQAILNTLNEEELETTQVELLSYQQQSKKKESEAQRDNRVITFNNLKKKLHDIMSKVTGVIADEIHDQDMYIEEKELV